MAIANDNQVLKDAVSFRTSSEYKTEKIVS